MRVSRLRPRFGAVRIFAHGGFSWQVQGKPRVLVVQSRLFLTCKGSAASLRNANLLAGTALCEPRSADIVAGTALRRFHGRHSTREPRRVDFVAGAALCEP